MANHGVRQQKKLAKQKAKRADKRTQLSRQSSDNPKIRLAQSATWPIVSTLVPSTLWNEGIGTLLIARRAPDGMLVAAALLVDTYCLGVKNAVWMSVSDGKYAEQIERIESSGGGKMRAVSPEYFAKLVLDSVDYAASIGLPPHSDFSTVRSLLNGIDPTLSDAQFEFGQNGKPYFVQGPNDSPEKIRLIVSKVNAAEGHFVLAGHSRSELRELLIESSEDDIQDDLDNEQDDDLAE